MGVLVIRTHMEMVDLVVMPRVQAGGGAGPGGWSGGGGGGGGASAIYDDLLENSLLSLPEAEEVVVDLGIEVLKVHQMESVWV